MKHLIAMFGGRAAMVETGSLECFIEGAPVPTDGPFAESARSMDAPPEGFTS